MANFLSSSTSITLLLPLLSAIIVLLFVSPAYSTSRLILDHRHETAATAGGGGGFRVSLRHIDSSQNKNLTKFELLKHAMKRGRKRLQKLNAMTTTTTTSKSSSSSLAAAASSDDQEIHSTVHAGNGEFLMELSIGTPPVPFSAIMDTGSDLIWTQCQPCKQCFDQSTPLFDPTKSSSFSKLPCSSPLCQSLPISTCGGEGDNDNDDHNTSCDYLYTYGDYSSTQGAMASETFTFQNNASVQKVGFGCGDDNEGSGFNQGAGLVGLGRGPLSLVSQLREPKFSYCLTSIDDTKTSSTLLMGSMAEESAIAIGLNSSKTTPLLKNPSQPSFYYLSLEGITVGDTPLAIKKSTFALNEDGSGGLIIDSGTTITYLEQSAFDVVKKEFIAQVKLEVDDSGSTTGLDLCFALPAGANSVEVPRLVFHFEGADLELPGENYMIADSSVGLMCLAMGGSSGMSIFGNVQQQNMLVLHDLQKETLSFIPTQCSQL